MPVESFRVHPGGGIAHSAPQVNIAIIPGCRYTRFNLWGQAMLYAIFWLIGELIQLMIYAIIIAAVLSMLIAFGVVNPRSQFVYTVGDFLNRVTYPVLSPIRRRLPNFGNVDISPIIAILLLEALSMIIASLYVHLVNAGLAF